jgi:hypothetical protein
MVHHRLTPRGRDRVITIKPNDTRLERIGAAGHRARKGHDQDSRLVSSDGELFERVNLCCGETIPESVPTLTERITGVTE